MVSGKSPTGPFSDPIGKPLIPEGLVPTYSRDPGVLMDDDGSNYLIFGTFSYFMAKLAPDMVSLAEKLRPVKINREQHRDDKPFLHRRGDTYYVSILSTPIAEISTAFHFCACLTVCACLELNASAVVGLLLCDGHEPLRPL